MNSLKLFSGALALAMFALWGGDALAVPVVDGTADAEYGTALSVQNTKTQFGDNTSADLIANSGGSEIDQIFATVANGRLFVTITGNLQTNFNKLEVYLDSEAGGINTVNSASLPAGVDPFSGGAFERQQGLTFDTGFDADYYLTFSHGGENHNGLGFWALTAHYAELNEGTAGRNVAAGMQLAPKGLPQVLRGPLGPDFNSDFDVDGQDLLTWQRGLGTTPAEKAGGDANDDDVVDGGDLDLWESRFDTDRTLADFPFNPFPGGPSTESLLGPTLPNLNQGETIDIDYITANGLLAAELDFANARSMNNSVDLHMALDNSNVAGVEGGGSPPWETTGDPANVRTGVEFSIPLSEVGNPTGSIKLFAFINGTGHDYASNQFSGEGILEANLGGNGFGGHTGDLSGVNLNDFLGDQFVTIPNPAVAAVAAIPEPSSVMLAAILVVLGGVVHRRS
jgi:hypothetical protein